MAEILTPGVKHREKPDLRAEMSPIGSDGTQRLGGRVEQDLVEVAPSASGSPERNGSRLGGKSFFRSKSQSRPSVTR